MSGEETRQCPSTAWVLGVWWVLNEMCVDRLTERNEVGTGGSILLPNPARISSYHLLLVYPRGFQVLRPFCNSFLCI